jgi:hypothetical protein
MIGPRWFSMPGVTIDHPARGWNQIPQQRGSYAWWDGRRFTTIAYLADDHWEHRREDTAERSEVQTVVEPDSPGSRIVAVVGLFISLVAALAVLLLPVILQLPSSDRESQLTDRVKDVHAHLETAGFKCSGGFDVTESNIPSHVPSLIYAEGRCGLELPRSIEIRAYRSQEEIKNAVSALRSDNGSYISGNRWYMEVYPGDLQLAHKIAAALNARVAGNFHSIVVLAPLQWGSRPTIPTLAGPDTHSNNDIQ